MTRKVVKLRPPKSVWLVMSSQTIATERYWFHTRDAARAFVSLRRGGYAAVTDPVKYVEAAALKELAK